MGGMESAGKFQFKSSAYGFRSIIPKSRAERRAAKDKVLIEKGRINQRGGWEAKMQRENQPATSAGLTSCPEDAAGYISNMDRFHSDTAGEEYELRQEKLRKEKDAIAFRKNKMEEREDLRWEREDKIKRDEEEYWERERAKGIKSKKNESAVAYDITTMVYKQDITGARQKYFDDMVKYRAKVRTHNLAAISDTRVNYNIISGEPRKETRKPEPVAKPSFLDYGLTEQHIHDDVGGPILKSKGQNAADIFAN